MKNFGILIGLVAVMVISACNKEYTCTCVTEVDGFGNTQTSTSSSTIEGKKSDAEDACNAGNSTTSFGGITTTVTCSLD